MEERFINENFINEFEEVEHDDILAIDELIFNDFKRKIEDDIDDDIIFLNDDDLLNESDEISIEQAIIDYKNGCEEAFDYIFSIYKPKLQRFANRMNDDDLAQELSIVLYRAVLKYNPSAGAKFNTFFWKCARNHIGTQKIRKMALKRGGNKNNNDELLLRLKQKEKNGEELTVEEQNLLIKLEEKAKPVKTMSLQATFDTKDSSVEIGKFIEDKSFKNQYSEVIFKVDLEAIRKSKLLKEKEYKAIQMIIQGYTLEEIGKELDNISAPAVHVMLRRLGKKKNIQAKLREMLY